MIKSFLFSIIICTTLLSFTKVDDNQDNTPQNSKLNSYSYIDKNYLLGKVKPEEDSIFVKIPKKYCLHRTEYIHKEALKPYLAMYFKAEKQGINLKIVSAFRSFNNQRHIWNRQFHGNSDKITVINSILRYSSMPGTSRHHWGTDIDLLSVHLRYFETEEGKKAYQWLCENAYKFGFYQVYTNKPYIGYNEEKWHWTYLPVSKIYLEEYKKQISYEDIIGFNGCEFAEKPNIIENYVFAIDSVLLR